MWRSDTIFLHPFWKVKDYTSSIIYHLCFTPHNRHIYRHIINPHNRKTGLKEMEILWVRIYEFSEDRSEAIPTQWKYSCRFTVVVFYCCSWYFWSLFSYISCIWMIFLYTCMCTWVLVNVRISQISLKWGYRRLWAAMWMLGTKLQPPWEQKVFLTAKSSISHIPVPIM